MFWGRKIGTSTHHISHSWQNVTGPMPFYFLLMTMTLGRWVKVESRSFRLFGVFLEGKSPASYLWPYYLMLRSQTLGCVLHFYVTFFSKFMITFFKIWLNRRDRVDCFTLVVIIYNLLIFHVTYMHVIWRVLQLNFFHCIQVQIRRELNFFFIMEGYY